MWFCSSGFGPGPSVTPARPAANGSAGPKLSRAKNAVDDEHHDQRPADERVVGALRGSATPTAAVNPARTSTHSRIEPSSADHIAATL